ncbi:MAG TPA: hypothetical protein VND21_04350 [Planctomycetota bacterium]|nr:hypothetical protein [Planctomycetota bacterium]
MRRFGLLVALVVAALAAWWLAGAGDSSAPDVGSSGAPDEADRGTSADLSSRPATASTVAFEPPPAPQAGARRLHLVGVGPPDRPAPDAAFDVWTYARGAEGRVRTDLPQHRTAPNEAWFTVSQKAGLVWFRATADRGRLVSMDGLSFEVPQDGPEPFVLRVPLFPRAELALKVVDADGRPIAGARILDAREEECAPPTDALGRTRVEGGVGSRSVHAVAVGHATSAQFHLSLAPADEGPFLARPGRGRAIVGRAVDEAGVPLAGVLSASSINAREQRTLAPDGSFRFEGLALPADASASIRLSAWDTERSLSANVPGPIPAGDGPLDLGIVRLTTRWTVPVRLLSPKGEPVLWVSVGLTREGHSPAQDDQRMPTSEEGVNFALADGRYEVRAKPFVVREPATLEVRGPWRGPPAEIVLEDARVVRGACIYHGSATPVWGMVMVRARAPKKEEDLISRVDAAGRFSLALPTALWEAPIEVETPYATLVEGRAAPKDGSDLVFDLPADRAWTLVVRAVDAVGRRLPFQWARFERVPSRALLDGWTVGPSVDGEATFWPVPRGDYRASVDLWDGTRAGTEAQALERDGQVITVTFDR